MLIAFFADSIQPSSLGKFSAEVTQVYAARMTLDLGTTEAKSRMWPMLTITVFGYSSQPGKILKPWPKFLLVVSPSEALCDAHKNWNFGGTKKFAGLATCDVKLTSCSPTWGKQFGWSTFCSHFHFWRSGASSTETSEPAPILQTDSGFHLPSCYPEATLLISVGFILLHIE